MPDLEKGMVNNVKCGERIKNMWIIIVCFMMCCGILLAETMIDIRKKRVHIIGAVLIAVCGVLQVIYQYGNTAGAVLTNGVFCRDLKDMVCGAAVGLCFLAVSLLTEGKFGKGDSFYLIALGMLLGFQKMMLMSMIAFLLSAAVGIILLISKKGDRKTQLPFLPFLTSSFLLLWIF